jgi:hypothetical protein
MSKVAPFHSINETAKYAARYHTDSECPQAQKISQQHLRQGSGGFYLCEWCAEEDPQHIPRINT